LNILQCITCVSRVSYANNSEMYRFVSNSTVMYRWECLVHVVLELYANVFTKSTWASFCIGCFLKRIFCACMHTIHDAPCPRHSNKLKIIKFFIILYISYPEIYPLTLTVIYQLWFGLTTRGVRLCTKYSPLLFNWLLIPCALLSCSLCLFHFPCPLCGMGYWSQ
jgi:hypothetical protein